MLMAFRVEWKDGTNIKAQDKGLLNTSTAFLPFLEAFPSGALLWSRWETMELREKAMVKTERFIKHFEGAALGDP